MFASSSDQRKQASVSAASLWLASFAHVSGEQKDKLVSDLREASRLTGVGIGCAIQALNKVKDWDPGLRHHTSARSVLRITALRIMESLGDFEPWRS